MRHKVSGGKLCGECKYAIMKWNPVAPPVKTRDAEGEEGSMIRCDTHADTLLRRLSRKAGDLDVTLEKLRQGNVNVQTLALFVGDSPRLEDISVTFQRMLAEKEKLPGEGWIQLRDPRDAREGQCGFMLSVEGCDLLDHDLSLLENWQEEGVRMAALTWNYPNCVGTPAAVDDVTGLSDFGKQAVREMVKRGIAVDTSHLNIRGFYDLLEMGVTPLASHSCCRALCGHRRNLTDEQLKALFAAGGYVGVNFYPPFLREDGKASVEDVFDHVIHMLEMGGEGKVGFGSDFDGIEYKPDGLDGPQDMVRLTEALEKRGLGKDTVRGIAGENLLLYYDRIDPR